MPGATAVEAIEKYMKKSLGFNKHKNEDLDQYVASSARRLLQQNIEFVPAKKPHSFQFSSLKSKYILLKPSKKDEETGATPSKLQSQTSFSGLEQKADSMTVMNGPGPSGDTKMGESLPTPRVVLYPPERVQLKWQRMHRVGGGLINVGNTCFMNATLQCLTYTPALANYCLSEEHPKTCRLTGICLMCTVRQQIRSALNHSGSAFKPNAILHKLKYIAKHFRYGRQEDAHEFLRLLMDGMQKACQGPHKKLDKLSKETTVVHQIFGGFLRSQVQCLKCTTRSNTYEPFLDLSLNLKGVGTVEEALAKFVKPETLDSANAYDCERCGRKQPAKKRFSVHKIPNVLTIQLNRFGFTRAAGKINRHIQFPEKLNLRPYMSHRQGEAEHYQLYAVLVHSGDHCSMGHYYCYVRAPSNVWYAMNDSSVHTASASRVFGSQAYLLFYTKTEPSLCQPSPKTPLIASAQTPNGVMPPKLNGAFSKLAAGDRNYHAKSGNDVGTPVSRQMVSPTKVMSSPFAAGSFSGSKSLSQKKKLFSADREKMSTPQQPAQNHKFPKDFFKRKVEEGEGDPGRKKEGLHREGGNTFTALKKESSDVPSLQREDTLLLSPRKESSDVPTPKKEGSVPTLKKDSSSVPKLNRENGSSMTKESDMTDVNPTPKLKKKRHSGDKLPPVLQRENGKASPSPTPTPREESSTPSLKKTKTFAGANKLSLHIPSLARVNSSPAVHNKWHIFPIDSNPSPSGDSCHSVPTTPSTGGQWTVTNSGKKRPLLETAESVDKAKKRKLSFSSPEKAKRDPSVHMGSEVDDKSSAHTERSQKHKHTAEPVNPFTFVKQNSKNLGAHSSTASAGDDTVCENGDSSLRDVSLTADPSSVEITHKKRKKKKKKKKKKTLEQGNGEHEVENSSVSKIGSSEDSQPLSKEKKAKHKAKENGLNSDEMNIHNEDGNSTSKKKKHNGVDSSGVEDMISMKDSHSNGKKKKHRDSEDHGDTDTVTTNPSASKGKRKRHRDVDVSDNEDTSARKDSVFKPKKKKHRHVDVPNGEDTVDRKDSNSSNKKKKHRDMDVSDEEDTSARKDSVIKHKKKKHRDMDDIPSGEDTIDRKDSNSSEKRKKHRDSGMCDDEDSFTVEESKSAGKKKKYKDLELDGSVEYEETSSLKHSSSFSKKKKHKNLEGAVDNGETSSLQHSSSFSKKIKHRNLEEVPDMEDSLSPKDPSSAGKKKKHRDVADASGDDDYPSLGEGVKRSDSENADKELCEESPQKKDKEAQKPSGKAVPVQAWHHYIKDRRWGKKKQEGEGQEAPPPAQKFSTLMWDGSRKSRVLEELCKRPSVTTWNGEKSEAEMEAEREEKRRKKKSWKDQYEEEIDKGKVKKVKRKVEDTPWAFNPFQKYQNHRNQEKFKWDEDFGSGSKTHSFTANSVPSLGRSQSEVFSFGQPQTNGNGESWQHSHPPSPHGFKKSQQSAMSRSHSFL